MAQKIATARAASTMVYPTTRHTDRRPIVRAGGASVRPDSLCLAADISASLLQEKDDSP